MTWTPEQVAAFKIQIHDVSYNFKPPELLGCFNVVTCSEVRILWQQEQTSPVSPPVSHRGIAHPGGLVVANVRASSRQSPGTVAGAGCLAQSNTPFIFSPC